MFVPIVFDIISLFATVPEGLQRLLSRAEKDDVIICTKMDRLGRNTADMIHIVDACYKKGIAIRFLENGLSTEGTMGKMVIQILAAVAEAERERILERTNDGIRHQGEPEVVTIDKSGANTAALSILNGDKAEEETITVRQSKYLNNLIEQDHRNIKRRIRSMLGFKSFRRAQTILAGIDLVHMIRKGQLQRLGGEHLSPAEQFYLLAA
ncbi:putative resolvase [Yersinia pekkanenii]|uniref:Resolvase n=1 Tax=Yersinia pekkanenii TaxID=1288385 RepID=A0ABP1ZXB7_9GAMM|nr:putative resolvase [Yersinia pekkanenii]